MERLTVLVMGNHTWSVGFGEEIEIVGDLYVLGSWTSSSRFGTGTANGGGDSGKAYPIFMRTVLNIQDVIGRSIQTTTSNLYNVTPFKNLHSIQT